jgi:hypothetical protein
MILEYELTWNAQRLQKTSRKAHWMRYEHRLSNAYLDLTKRLASALAGPLDSDQASTIVLVGFAFDNLGFMSPGCGTRAFPRPFPSYFTGLSQRGLPVASTIHSDTLLSNLTFPVLRLT